MLLLLLLLKLLALLLLLPKGADAADSRAGGLVSRPFLDGGFESAGEPGGEFERLLRNRLWVVNGATVVVEADGTVETEKTGRVAVEIRGSVCSAPVDFAADSGLALWLLDANAELQRREAFAAAVLLVDWAGSVVVFPVSSEEATMQVLLVVRESFLETLSLSSISC